MKTNSSHNSNQPISNLFNTDNCNCICHYPDDIEIDEDQNTNIHKTEEYIKSPFQKKLFQKKNSESLCICDQECSCTCHCETCLCCPCVKEKKGIIIKIYILK